MQIMKIGKPPVFCFLLCIRESICLIASVKQGCIQISEILGGNLVWAVVKADYAFTD